MTAIKQQRKKRDNRNRSSEPIPHRWQEVSPNPNRGMKIELREAERMLWRFRNESVAHYIMGSRSSSHINTDVTCLITRLCKKLPLRGFRFRRSRKAAPDCRASIRLSITPVSSPSVREIEATCYWAAPSDPCRKNDRKSTHTHTHPHQPLF